MKADQFSRQGSSPNSRQVLAWAFIVLLICGPAQAMQTEREGIPEAWASMAKEPITKGNSVELLVGGKEFFPRRLALIEEAEHQIDLLMFLWCPDESGFKVAEALAAAARRGVRVRVGVDFFNNKGAAPVYDLMEQAGVKLIIFNPPRWRWTLNERMHEKVMLVDREVALLGGANICDEYMLETAARGLWQDYEIEVRGPGASRIQARFDETWSNMLQTQEDLERRHAAVLGHSLDTARSRTLSNPPTRHQSRSPIAAGRVAEPGSREHELLVHYQQPYQAETETDRALMLYIHFLHSAESRIVFHTPYMAPPRPLKAALIDAVERDVEVQILTNSPHTNDLIYIFSLAARARYRALIEAGVEIYESPRTTLHGKAIIIDDSVAAIGSHNFTHRSFHQNSEIKVITNDPVVVNRLSSIFDQNMERFTQVTNDDLDAKEPSGPLWLLGRWAGYLY